VTRYILAGGGDRKDPAKGRRLCEAFTEGLSRPVRILDCFFAEPRETWEQKFANFKAFYAQHLGNNATPELAFPATFEEQAAKADVIYLHGGDDTLLGHYLKQYPDLTARIFKDKTVVGSSAGASFLSTFSWTCDWREARPGSGIVPVRVIVHYGSNYGSDDSRGPIDWRQARAALAPHHPELSLHSLAEGEFIIIEQE
jgi:hypothetical protein